MASTYYVVRYGPGPDDYAPIECCDILAVEVPDDSVSVEPVRAAMDAKQFHVVIRLGA